MIFYQLRRRHDQKHLASAPQANLSGICWRYLNSIFSRSAILLVILISSFSKAEAQKITITAKQQTIRSIMDKIEQQSGYDFWYNKDTFNEGLRINVNVNAQSLNDVLNKIFIPRQLEFEIVDKTIFLKPAQKKTMTNSVDSPRNEITGIIKDEKGEPIVSATIKVKDHSVATFADNKGSFKIAELPESGTLIVTSMGFNPQEIPFSPSTKNDFVIVLTEKERVLEDVQIVSNGYQNIPKERATGSFVQIDNELINRAVSTNILDRLNGVTNGLIFNKSLPNTGNNSALTIRGRSTIFSNPDPLIVIDNFPYDGTIDNINPADVESITILKDAAAASIWGVRAGNGVIVITTKKGGFNNKSVISFNSNHTFGGKPDLFYRPQLSSSDYVDAEIYLFKKGNYDASINSGYNYISGVVDVLNQRKNNKITAADSASRIDRYKNLDNRSQIKQNLYRNSYTQQYQLNMAGGSSEHKYYLSGSYDKSSASQVANKSDRLVLNANNTWQLLKGKGELFTGMTFTNTKSRYNNSPYTPITPYELLLDDSGNKLAVFGGRQAFRKSYIDTAGSSLLLDWNYRPLDENGANSTNSNTDFRTTTNLRYKILSSLSASANYQYEKGMGQLKVLNEENSFYSRNLINTYSSINQTTNAVNRIIPLGAMLERSTNSFYSHYGRIQLNFDKSIADNHSVSALAGFEIKDLRLENSLDQYYGYDNETANNKNLNIDPTTLYTLYYDNTAQAKVPFLTGQQWGVDRYRSYYLNASYEYKNRLVVSGSARKDESNLFGVKSNQKGVPLWSAGLLYKISNEEFYKLSWLPQISLRATYGFNGNVNKSVSALLTSSLYITNPFNTQYSQIINPPNPTLRWEKVKNLNMGIDFSIKDQLLFGSIEYYQKRGEDLIGNAFIAPQTGIYQFKGNTASIWTRGWDIKLSSHIADNNFKLYTDFLFSYANDKVTKYGFKQPSNFSIAQSNPQNPLEGYPYYALFSFQYKGLDNTGNPVGYSNGQESKNYASILNSANSNELIYSGSATPLFFGSLRNTISYGPAELSLNITYKLGYYFRRPSISYSTLYISGSSSYNQADFSSRWQKPGDENHTNVPGQIYPADANRDRLYLYSTALIEKADHVRLRDIKLSYKFTKSNSGLKNLKATFYASNLGIIWKSTKYDIDPDYAFNSVFPDPFSLSAGFSFNL